MSKIQGMNTHAPTRVPRKSSPDSFNPFPMRFLQMKKVGQKDAKPLTIQQSGAAASTYDFNLNVRAPFGARYAKRMHSGIFSNQQRVRMSSLDPSS